MFVFNRLACDQFYVLQNRLVMLRRLSLIDVGDKDRQTR